MTLPGIPLVYYGDEIGMRFIDGLPNKEGSQLTKGNRAGSRTPMQWDSSNNAGFSSGSSNSLYLPLDSSANRPTVEQGKKDPSSLLLFTKELIALRGKYAALGNRGEIRFLQSKENQYPLIYERRLGKEAFIIVINPSGKDVSISLDYDKVVKRVVPVLSCSKHKMIGSKNKQLTISAESLSYGIYRIY
jgi:Glycosidases